MGNEKLDKLIKAQLSVNQSIKDLKAHKESLKSEILVELKTADITEYDDLNGNKVLINKYNRTSIDKEKVEKFCEDTGQELSFFQKTVEIEQLKVIEAKKGGEHD